MANDTKPVLPPTTIDSPPLNEYLVIVPDMPAVDLAHRLSVRKNHLIKMLARFKAGQVSWGGAVLEELLSSESDSDSDNGVFASGSRPTGSAMLYRAESMQEVRSWVENDIYATSGVWDITKAQYLPFKTAALPVQN